MTVSAKRRSPNCANRAFVTLLAVGGSAYVVLGMSACAMLGFLGYQLGTRGIGSVGVELLPAAAFLLLIGAGMILGTASAVRQLLSTRRLAARLRDLQAPLPAALEDAARDARLAGRVELVDDVQAYSFAYGLLVPRVAVSRGLMERCTASELEAVLEHERYHVSNLDPLKLVVARTVPAWLYFAPVVRTLRRRYSAGRELAADRRAVRRLGTAAVAGALYKALQAPEWPELRAAAAIGGPDLLWARVAQLEGGREPPLPGTNQGEVIWSVVGLSVVAAMFFLGATAAAPLVAERNAVWGSSMSSAAGVVGGVVCLAFWSAIGLVVVRAACSRRV